MKENNFRIALAQINCTVGDLSGNSRKIKEYIQKASRYGACLVSFPELAITGYPPEDLLLKPKFIEDNIRALKDLAKTVSGIVAIVGFVDKKGASLYNSAAVLASKKIAAVYHKMFLPNYGVFDEKRYFECGNSATVFSISRPGSKTMTFGVNICEDIWHADGPVKKQAKLGASLIMNISSSPYYAGKIKDREAIILSQAKENKVFIAYNNLVGAQDELVFDGQSMVINDKGKVISRSEAFKEDLLVVDLNIESSKRSKAKTSFKLGASSDTEEIPKRKLYILEPVKEVYEALVLGLCDYVRKNGFSKVVIGLSGGVDSSIVACLAVDALGKENVTGVFMPSRYSSEQSRLDAEALAGNLGIKLFCINIENIYNAYLNSLEPFFKERNKDITEENLQARIRGALLMALSNKFGWLVLATGNKSEMSTGYATLYGDMAGGFAVIKDVPKMFVYKLAAYRNSVGFIIPESVITKEPTAELKPNQKDSDTLPEYKVLDEILKGYIELDKDLKEIAAGGLKEDLVRKVLTMVDRSEYKRRQAPAGIKITPKAFGKDRRMPITNRYGYVDPEKNT